MRRKHAEITLLAIRFAVLLHKSSSFERAATVGAEEVVWMPRLAQGVDALVENRTIAIGAAWAEELVVALLAVRLAIALKE